MLLKVASLIPKVDIYPHNFSQNAAFSCQSNQYQATTHNSDNRLIIKYLQNKQDVLGEIVASQRQK
jgi:hypothetical protein